MGNLNYFFELLYCKRCAEIYNLTYNEEMSEYERKVGEKQDVFKAFLKNNLDNDKYLEAFKILDEMMSKENEVSERWNKVFFFDGFKQGMRLL